VIISKKWKILLPLNTYVFYKIPGSDRNPIAVKITSSLNHAQPHPIQKCLVKVRSQLLRNIADRQTRNQSKSVNIVSLFGGEYNNDNCRDWSWTIGRPGSKQDVDEVHNDMQVIYYVDFVAAGHVFQSVTPRWTWAR